MEGDSGFDDALPKVSAWPLNRSPEGVRQWIREVCEALSVSPTKLAAMAEVAHTTISRFQSGRSVNKNISPSTIGAISAVIVRAVDEGKISFKKDPLAHIQLKENATAQKLMAQSHSKLTFSGLSLTNVQVEGHVGHGIRKSGQEEIMWHDVELTILVDPMFMLSELFGLEMRDEDNEYFKRGDLLICTFDMMIFNGVEDGSFIVISRNLADDAIESALFVCRPDPNGRFWLMPTWKNWNPAEQVFLGASVEDGLLRLALESPRKIAVVVSSLRSELSPLL